MSQIEDGVEEIRSVLRADGGDVELVHYDPDTSEIELKLLLGDANCAECVLPRELLESMGLDMVRAHAPAVRSLTIRDPRESTEA